MHTKRVGQCSNAPTKRRKQFDIIRKWLLTFVSNLSVDTSQTVINSLYLFALFLEFAPAQNVVVGVFTMAAVKDLQEMRNIYFYINELNNDLQRLKESETSLVSPSMCSAAVQHQKTFDKLERQVIKYMSEFERLAMITNDRIAQLATTRNQAINNIMSMKEGQARRFLTDYYIECKSMTDLIDEYCYSDPESIYNLHRRALTAYKKHMEKLAAAEK